MAIIGLNLHKRESQLAFKAETARSRTSASRPVGIGSPLGLERPFYVKFGPDGAMYVVDYGVARINPASMGTPYEFPPNTGSIWKITRTGQ